MVRLSLILGFLSCLVICQARPESHSVQDTEQSEIVHSDHIHDSKERSEIPVEEEITEDEEEPVVSQNKLDEIYKRSVEPSDIKVKETLPGHPALPHSEEPENIHSEHIHETDEHILDTEERSETPVEEENPAEIHKRSVELLEHSEESENIHSDHIHAETDEHISDTEERSETPVEDENPTEIKERSVEPLDDENEETEPLEIEVKEPETEKEIEVKAVEQDEIEARDIEPMLEVSEYKNADFSEMDDVPMQNDEPRELPAAISAPLFGIMTQSANGAYVFQPVRRGGPIDSPPTRILGDASLPVTQDRILGTLIATIMEIFQKLSDKIEAFEDALLNQDGEK